MIALLRKTLGPIKYKLLNARVAFDPLPHGTDPFVDIGRLLKGYDFDVAFDVGANVGDVSASISKRFPDCEIYSFEPVKATYEHLKKRLGENPRTHAFNIGLGARSARLVMSTQGTSSMNSLNNAVFLEETTNTEEVEIETLDAFMQRERIAKVSYLKVDTEGFDLEVLNGALEGLKRQAFDFIEVEAGAYPNNDVHVYFTKFLDFLEPFEYQLFGFYEQVHEWKFKRPFLRRTNLVFISQALADRQNTVLI